MAQNIENVGWISCDMFTCKYKVNKDTRIITAAAPIIKKFKGQHENNLIDWVRYKCSSYMLQYLDQEYPGEYE